jgi:acetyl esterase/lipase
MHYAKDDPLIDVDQLSALEQAVRAAGVPVDVYAYEGVAHLFEDPDTIDHDPAAAQLLMDRVLLFLGRLDDHSTREASSTEKPARSNRAARRTRPAPPPPTSRRTRLLNPSC